jgi:uncharacterized protein YdaU (DUF1376 family)
MSEEKVDAWMPLWIGAYLADTMRLTTTQHGAYLLLLFAYWRNRGPLEDDHDDLSSIVKASPSEWKKLRPKIEKFFTVEDGHWVHSRADKELASAGLRKANATAKAQAAAEARWGKNRKHSQGQSLEECSEHAPSIAQALHEDCPTPSPISPSLRSGEGAKRAARPKKNVVTLSGYLATCKAEGRKPLPPDHAVRGYCTDAGITDEMLQVAWIVFKDRHLNGQKDKTYADWPATFSNSVKSRWYSLWMPNSEGSAEWTATGIQERRVIETRTKPQQEQTHEHA